MILRVSCKVNLTLEKVSMGHGCPRLLFLFHLQLNIGYTISEQDTIYILQTEFSVLDKTTVKFKKDLVKL